MKTLFVIVVVFACVLPTAVSATVSPGHPSHDQLFWTLSLVNLTLGSVNAILLAKNTPREPAAYLSIGAGVFTGMFAASVALDDEFDWSEPAHIAIVVTSALAVTLGVLDLRRAIQSQTDHRLSLGLLAAPSGPPRAVGIRVRF